MTYQYDTIDKLKAAQDRGAVIRCDQLDGLAWMTAEELGLDRFEFDSSLDDYAVMRDPMFPDGPSGRVEWSLYTPECGPVYRDGKELRTNFVMYWKEHPAAWAYSEYLISATFSPPCTNPAETSTQTDDVRITELEAQLARAMKVVDAAKALKLPSGDFIEYLLAGKGIYEALKANGFLEEL